MNPAKTEHLRVGTRGEKIAIDYLRKKGWKIVETNYETHTGEIDIIARKEWKNRSYLSVAFVEVKTRTKKQQLPPELSVTRAKRRKIISVAREYISKNFERFATYRFDIISVDLSGEKPEINHFKSAFDKKGNPF